MKGKLTFDNATKWDRTDYLFLDPDTGIWLPKPSASKRLPDSKREPEYLMAEELLRITKERAGTLVLVFDQSITHGKEEIRRAEIERKLRWFKKRHVYGIAYFSHANFLIMSEDSNHWC